MCHQLMKTTVRSKGRRYISGEGCLLLRQEKLNSHQERADPNRWSDPGETQTAKPSHCHPRGDHSSQGLIQHRDIAGENQPWHGNME